MVNAEENNASSGGAPEPEQFRKLFIGGLTTNTTDEMLKEFYEQWGELVDCIVMRDSATKRSRGFGFVTYSSRAQVDTCMAARPHIIDGKTVDPKRAVPRELSTRSEANVSTKRLYVSGVREDHNDQMFRDYFQRFGPVHEVEVIQDKNTGKNRGFAFVTFEDYDAVDQCVLAKSHMIDNKRCDVKKALSKEEMKKAQQTDRERTERGVRSRDPPGRGEQGGWGGGGGYGGGGGGWGGGGGGGGYGGGYSGGAGGGWGGGGGGAAYGAAGGYGGGYDAGSWGGGAGAGWNAGGSAGGQGGWGAPAGGAMSQQQYWPPAPAPNPAPAAGGWGAAGGAGAASWGAGGGGGAAGHAAGGQWSGRSY